MQNVEDAKGDFDRLNASARLLLLHLLLSTSPSIEIQIDTKDRWAQYTTVSNTFNNVEHIWKELNAGQPIRSVYTIANDMKLMKGFYEAALELPLAFRDVDSWRPFKARPVLVALSSSAAEGGRGGGIIFGAIDLAAMTQRIGRLSGQLLSSRDGAATFAERENNLFQPACSGGRLDPGSALQTA